MIGTFGAVILVAQSALGFSGHHGKKAGCCDACGVETLKVLNTIQTLQTCPRWRQRDDAAHDLRKYDPKCHPEVIDALTTALLADCEEEVREEAAQSLKKLGTCTPESHVALRRAASSDPDWATRFWAKRALATVGRKCEGACAVCRPGLPVVSAPVVIGEPVLAPEVAPLPEYDPTPIPSEARILPPSDLPPASDSPPPFPVPAPAPGEPDMVPPLEGPIREGKRVQPDRKVARVVRLIPGLRGKPVATGGVRGNR